MKLEARDCGKANGIAGIFAALRSCSGLTNRKARAKLTTLRKICQTSLQAHTAEVDWLVKVAYADLPEQHISGMTLDTFCSTVDNAYLQ